MQKTKKSMMKRFKVTATGKVMHRTPGCGHLRRHKTSRQLRHLAGDKQLAKGMASNILKCISVGL